MWRGVCTKGASVLLESRKRIYRGANILRLFGSISSNDIVAGVVPTSSALLAVVAEQDQEVFDVNLLVCLEVGLEAAARTSRHKIDTSTVVSYYLVLQLY